jgi:hypothetical protein
MPIVHKKLSDYISGPFTDYAIIKNPNASPGQEFLKAAYIACSQAERDSIASAILQCENCVTTDHINAGVAAVVSDLGKISS